MAERSIAELEAEIAKRSPGHERFKKRERIRFIRTRENPEEAVADLKRYGFVEKKVDYDPIDRCLKSIIRMEASGYVNEANLDEMSDDFKDALRKPIRYDLVSDQYNLNKIQCWKYAKQFQEFGTVGKKVQRALARRKINPLCLSKMNFEDITYLLNDERPSDVSKDKGFIIFEGSKKKFVKKFAKENSYEFYQVLKKKPEYGNSRDILDRAIKYGKLPKGLQVHHDVMVTSAKNLKNIKDINSYDKYKIVDEIIHKYLHKALNHDKKSLKENDTLKYFSIPDDVLVCGEKPEYRVKINGSKNKEVMAKKLKDKQSNKLMYSQVEILRERHARV